MSRSRPGGYAANGIMNAKTGQSRKGPTSSSGNRAGVSPTEEVEVLKTEKSAAENMSKIRNPVAISKYPYIR